MKILSKIMVCFDRQAIATELEQNQRVPFQHRVVGQLRALGFDPTIVAEIDKQPSTVDGAVLLLEAEAIQMLADAWISDPEHGIRALLVNALDPDNNRLFRPEGYQLPAAVIAEHAKLAVIGRRVG